MSAPFTCKHILYRLFDAIGELLYIGITNDLGRRMEDHAREQSWWGEVADCRTEFFPSRESLEAAEVLAIELEKPRYNIRHAAAGARVKPVCVLIDGAPAGRWDWDVAVGTMHGQRYRQFMPVIPCAVCKARHPHPIEQAVYVPEDVHLAEW